jgi:hypothetical protein
MRTAKRLPGGILVTTQKYGDIFVAVENSATEDFYKELGTSIWQISAEAGYHFFNVSTSEDIDKTKSPMLYTPEKYANSMLYFVPFLAGMAACRPANRLYSLEALASFYVNGPRPLEEVSKDSLIAKTLNFNSAHDIMKMINLPSSLDVEDYKRRAFLDDMSDDSDIDKIVVELISEEFTDDDIVFYGFLTMLNSIFFAAGEHTLDYQL